MAIQSTKLDLLVINGYEQDYIFNTIRETNDFYEATMLRNWTPYISDAQYIFDVGANLGNHSLYWATNTNAKMIYAFEPLPENFEILKKNIEDNCLSNVICIPSAVGEHSGSVVLCSLDKTNMGSATFEECSDSGQTISLISLDEFIAENNITMVDFVKIDTEGFEIQVIQGMRRILEYFHPDICVEISGKTQEIVRKELQAVGYILVDLRASNLMFLHPSRHVNIVPYDPWNAIPEFYQHLEKRNNYYGLYTKVKAEANRLHEAYKTTQVTSTEYKHRWEQSLEVIKEQKMSAEKANAAYKQAQESVANYKGRWEKANASYKQAQESIADYKERWEKANASYKQAQESIADYKGRWENASIAYRNVQKDIDQKNNDIKALKSEKDSYIHQISTLTESNALLLGQLSAILATYEQMRILTYTMQRDLSKFDQAMQQKDKEIKRLIDDNRQKDKEIERFIGGNLLKCQAKVFIVHFRKFLHRRAIGKPILHCYRFAKKIIKK